MKKKSLRKRMMAVGIVLSMTAALLAGCGGSGEKEAKTSESEKKELVMWTFMSKENSYGKAFYDAVDAFSESSGV